MPLEPAAPPPRLGEGPAAGPRPPLFAGPESPPPLPPPLPSNPPPVFSLPAFALGVGLTALSVWFLTRAYYASAVRDQSRDRKARQGEIGDLKTQLDAARSDRDGLQRRVEGLEKDLASAKAALQAAEEKAAAVPTEDPNLKALLMDTVMQKKILEERAEALQARCLLLEAQVKAFQARAKPPAPTPPPPRKR